nr:SAM-dependent methyltransferase [Francisella tularensis]
MRTIACENQHHVNFEQFIYSGEQDVTALFDFTTVV